MQAQSTKSVIKKAFCNKVVLQSQDQTSKDRQTDGRNDGWVGWPTDGRTDTKKHGQRTLRQTGRQTGILTLERHTHTFGQTERQTKNTVTHTRVRMRTLGRACAYIYGK